MMASVLNHGERFYAANSDVATKYILAFSCIMFGRSAASCHHLTRVSFTSRTQLLYYMLTFS